MRSKAVAPSASTPSGSSVRGPARRTVAPSLVSAWMSDRATRLCVMSPQIATVSPATFPLCARMVEQSSNACVGCSWAPSPAFTTEALMCFATISAAPAWPWRMTTMSGCMASRFAAVSSSVSPLTVDDVEPEMLTASADSRLAAISNDVRVRVDGSRNRLMTVFPRSVGTFLIGRDAISPKRSPRSRIVVRSSAESVSMPSRCLCGNDVMPAVLVTPLGRTRHALST